MNVPICFPEGCELTVDVRATTTRDSVGEKRAIADRKGRHSIRGGAWLKPGSPSLTITLVRLSLELSGDFLQVSRI